MGEAAERAERDGRLNGVAFNRRQDRACLRARDVLASGGIGALVVLVDWSLPGVVATAWFLPLAYFVLSIAHDGVRLGRKTYIVDLAGGNKRTDYVAVSNTVIGVVLLVVIVLGVALLAILLHVAERG